MPICKIIYEGSYAGVGFTHTFYRDQPNPEEFGGIVSQLRNDLFKALCRGASYNAIKIINTEVRFAGVASHVINVQTRSSVGAGELPQRAAFLRLEGGPHVRRQLHLRCIPDVWVTYDNTGVQDQPTTAAYGAFQALRETLLPYDERTNPRGGNFLIRGRFFGGLGRNPAVEITELTLLPAPRSGYFLRIPGLALPDPVACRVRRCSEALHLAGRQVIFQEKINNVPVAGLFYVEVESPRLVKPYRGKAYVQFEPEGFVPITEVIFERFSTRKTGASKLHTKGRHSRAIKR